MSQENTSLWTNTTSSSNNNTGINDVERVTPSSFIEKLPIESRIEVLKTSTDAIKPTTLLPIGTFEYELFCMNDVTIENNTSEIIETGIVLSFDLSHRYLPKICDKTAVVLLKHCHVLGGILVNGGSIKVILFNFDKNETVHFQKGDPIAQIIFFPILIPKLVPMSGRKRKIHTVTNNNNNNSNSSCGDFVRKENVTIEFFKTNNDAITPTTYPPHGYDLFCSNDFRIRKNSTRVIDTGIVLSMDPNARYFPMICDKYSVPKNKNCHVLGGILDPGYRTSIKVILFNCDNNEDVYFSKGNILAQIIFFPVLLPNLNLIRNDYGFTGDRIHGSIADDFLIARAAGRTIRDSDQKTTSQKNKSINATTKNNNYYYSMDDDDSGDDFDGFVGTENLTIDILKTSNNAIIPMRLSPDSVGYDLFCISNVTVKSNSTQIIDTGIYLCKNISDRYYPKICDKSSVVLKKHCYVLGATTHPNFRESIKVILFNYDNNEDVHFQKGYPIAQLVFFPIFSPYLYSQNDK